MKFSSSIFDWVATFVLVFTLIVVLPAKTLADYERSAAVVELEKRGERLDPRYTVEWETHIKHKLIQFTVVVETTGYIGFGLSLTGTMNGADIVIAGVNNNGTTYFGDYHGTGNTKPTLDNLQNWELVGAGSEVDGVTTVSFRRAWDTCDYEGDLAIAITNGTLKMIWAIGESDTITQHLTSNRGALAVNILDPPLPTLNLSSYNLHEVTMNYTLNGEETVYFCTVQKRNVGLEGPSHVIAFKPKLETSEALKHTHHFNVWFCKGDNIEHQLEPFVDAPQSCLDGAYLPKRICRNNLFAWSLGGRIMIFPDEIGFRWGEDPDEFFLFEVHIDNPDSQHNITFETGVQIYHTYEFRQLEAGLVRIGHVTDTSLLIPPDTSNWTLAGHCSSACTSKTLQIPSIKLFNVNLHSHVSGRKLKLRHFRDGQELPWIAIDNTYDFNFQESRPLREELEVVPGDHLTLECTYDSTWKSPPSSVIGGFGTADEMCLVFVFYYPKTDLEFCFSKYRTDKLLERFEIEEYSGTYPNFDIVIHKPDKWANLTFSQVLTDFPWTNDSKLELQTELQFGEHYDYCNALGGDEPSKSNRYTITSDMAADSNDFPVVKYPEFEAEYYEEGSVECRTTGNGGSSTSMSFKKDFIIHVILCIIIVLCKFGVN